MNEWPDNTPRRAAPHAGTPNEGLVAGTNIPRDGLAYMCADCGASYPVDPVDPFDAHGKYLDHLEVHEAGENEQMPVLEDPCRYRGSDRGAGLMDRLHARTCPMPCCGPTGDPITDDRLSPYFLTFGVQYALEPHPRGAWVRPDGYVVVFAPSYGEARTVVVDLFGRNWSDLYDRTLFSDPVAARRHCFPRGELLRIIVPAGLVEVEDHRD